MQKNSYFLAKNLTELQSLYKRTATHKGFTLIETLIVLALVGIMAALITPYLSFGNDPLRDTTNRIAGDFKLMRAQAMAQTSAYRVRQISETQLTIENARSCSDTTWHVAPSFNLEDLRLTEAKDIQGLTKNKIIKIVAVTVNGVSVSISPLTTTWTLCYNSRGLVESAQGLSNVDLVLTLKDCTKPQNCPIPQPNPPTLPKKRIEVFPGGTVQIYED